MPGGALPRNPHRPPRRDWLKALVWLLLIAACLAVWGLAVAGVLWAASRM